MTGETTTSLQPSDVLAVARAFFTGRDAVHPAWIEAESTGHVSFATFRSNIIVSAFPDGEKAEVTRVRVSSLRDQAAVGKFLTYLDTAAADVAADEQAAAS